MPASISQPPASILIVGAGAVGQVYGYHLARGGARVGVLVRPRQREHALAGYTLHLRGIASRVRRVHWSPDEVLTSVSEVVSGAWQQVWLCVPSDRLREAWLPELLSGVGASTVISQHTAPDDRQTLLRQLDARQLVEGTISFMSWSVDLQEDGLGSDVRALLPPMADCFSGPANRLSSVVTALRSGGHRARMISDAGARYRLLGALSLPLMAALELSNWSIARLVRGPQMSLGCGAGREALMLCGDRPEIPHRLLAWLWRGVSLGPLLTLVRWLSPLPMEDFLEQHFTKVGAQTRILISEYLMRARSRGFAAPCLRKLARELGIED